MEIDIVANPNELDEDQALRLVQALRSKFGWSGTNFMRSDVAEHVREQWAEQDSSPPLSDEVEVALVDAVMASYTYRKLADRFAELGNELLADAANGAIAEYGEKLLDQASGDPA